MKRLPTKAEFEALLNLPHKCDEKRKGLLITADNGNELFFPALGYKLNVEVYDLEHDGYYWSDTPYNKGNAWLCLIFYSYEAYISGCIRYFGLSVRLVSDTPCNGYIDMGTGIYWAIENYQNGEKIYFTLDEAMVIPQKINGGKVECSYPNYNLLNLNQNSIACTHVPEEHLLTIPKSTSIDWEQRRYEIAKAAMHGILTMPIDPKYDSNISFEEIAHRSVAIADELIKQLKQKQL